MLLCLMENLWDVHSEIWVLFYKFIEKFRFFRNTFWHVLRHVPTIFATSRRKALDSNGPYISTSQTKIRKVYLYVGYFEILSVVVVCLWSGSTSAVYTSLCRGLKYLLNVPYIILGYPILVGSLIFDTLNLGSSKALPYVWK